MNKTKVKIAICDDHLLIARAIAGIVDEFEGYEVLFEAENGLLLQKKMKTAFEKPDIVLMDISMPVMGGIETTQWLSKHHPDVSVLVLSMQDDEYSLVSMIKAGAKGFLLKNCQPGELEKALNNIVSRGMYFPDWATTTVVKTISGNLTPDGVSITEREREFLKWSASELTYKEIGVQMNCSSRTVESYRDSLFEKAGLKTRIGLVLFGIRQKIINV